MTKGIRFDFDILIKRARMMPCSNYAPLIHCFRHYNPIKMEFYMIEMKNHRSEFVWVVGSTLCSVNGRAWVLLEKWPAGPNTSG